MKSTYPNDRRAGSVADGTNESKSSGRFMVFQEFKGQCGWSTEQRGGLYERRQARGQVMQAVSQARLTALFFWPKRLAWGRKRRGLPSF